MHHYTLNQRFPTWAHLTIRRGTFIVQPQRRYLYNSKNVKVLLKVQRIFVILLSLSVKKNFRGISSSVEMLNGYMVRERLGTPALNHAYLRGTWSYITVCQ